MTMSKKEITLKVAEAMQDDAYKGVARIDIDSMRELDLKRGDVISINGSRQTVAIADRAYPADMGEGIIRIDGVLRRNAKTSIGDNVTVSKIEVAIAKKIIIAPAQKGITVQAEPNGLKKGLLGRALMKGDLFVLGGVQRRKDLLGPDMPGELNDMLGGMLENMGMGAAGQLGNVSQIKFKVVGANPNKPFIITEDTEVGLNSQAVDDDESSLPNINYEDIGGLSDEIKKIREMVEIPMRHPEVFHRLGVEPPKGVLLHGPPGTGKTLLAKAVASETEANFILLNGPEIMSKFYGESEKKIREIFKNAEENAPSIIFIDEIDAIAPKREDTHGEVERRVVSQLLTMMDGLKARGKVVVIGATNRINALDPALRRPGRFDREIEVGVPDKVGRLSVLKIHTRGMPLAKNVKLKDLASLTHGFVGADLESLTKEAAMNVLRKVLPDLHLDKDDAIAQEILDKLIVGHSDFVDALKVVRPSAMREVLVETPNVKWAQVGGLEDIKSELKEAVEWPIKHAASFKRMGIRAPRGILLYGPPGTGKTLLAKAVANESEANFIQVKGPSLLSKWVNDSHKGMQKVFERARQVAPCIVFFDEIESLAARRGANDNASSQEATKVLNQLLSEMDGMEDLKDVLVIGATNRPDMLDNALLRPGRFDKVLLVNAPEEVGRLGVLKIHTRNTPIGEKDKELIGAAKEKMLAEIAKKTEGYTGADLESVTREAAMLALRENIDCEFVSKNHFIKALEKVKPSVTSSTIKTYKKIEDDYLKSAKAAVPESSYLG